MSLDYGVVFGCPRSGTTFLMEVLNTLPRSECMIGTILPVSIPQIVNAPIPEEIYRALAVGFERALDDYMHSGRFRSRAASLQKWVVTGARISGFASAARGIRSVDRMIYKEPFLAFSPEFVNDALPAAAMVHIVRDGRDCANSLVRSYDVLTDERLTNLLGAEMRLGRKHGRRFVPWWVGEGDGDAFLAATPYVRSIWMWKYMVRRCHEFGRRPDVADSGRLMEIRYEDLMRDPLRYGTDVARHFGEKPTRTFVNKLKRAHTSSIQSYKRRDPAEVAAAEKVAGEELALYGYL